MCGSVPLVLIADLSIARQMNIGPYALNNNLILAPMAGVTDRPFRQLCRRMGAGMAVSEMVSSNSLLWGSKKTQRRANHEGEPDPKSVQIMGADPKMMALSECREHGKCLAVSLADNSCRIHHQLL